MREACPYRYDQSAVNAVREANRLVQCLPYREKHILVVITADEQICIYICILYKLSSVTYALLFRIRKLDRPIRQYVYRAIYTQDEVYS